MNTTDNYVWLNGKQVAWDKASVHVLTHTMHYGVGVFEGVRAYTTNKGAAIFRLHEHTKRLFESARLLSMHIPFSQAEINQAQKDVVTWNRLESAYIRPLVFFSYKGADVTQAPLYADAGKAMGLRASNLQVNVMVAAWNWGTYFAPEKLEKGIAVGVSSFTRLHVNVNLTRAKAVGHYINSILAVQEAQRHGYDEALLLDVDGYVSEGSGENIFIVKDGVAYTPSLETCLNGITRNTIFAMLEDMQIPLVQKRLTRDDVYLADEAFFTGTAAEITPIGSIDGQIFDGQRKVTDAVRSLYSKLVRGEAGKKDWLHSCKD